MRRIVAYSILALIGVAIAGLVVYRVNQRGAGAKTPRSNVPQVKVSTPVQGLVLQTLQFTGDVLPLRQAGIFSRVSGNLERTFVEMGDRVRQGQLLAIIDSTELFQRYQQASATHQNAQLSYTRMKELYGRDLASKQDYDNAETSARIARANYDLAATNLGYARIIAPFSGIVTRRFLDSGALVTPGNTTLFMLMDLDKVKVVISVLEKDIPSVTPGKEAIVTVDAYPGKQFTGTIKRLSEAVDPDTRTMPVEIDILNHDHTLKPGMFASVTFIVDRREGAITVPVTAILKDNQGPYLFTVRSDTARKVRIVPGVEQDSTVEILSGISDTTMKIITTGQQFVRDGNPVAVQ